MTTTWIASYLAKTNETKPPYGGFVYKLIFKVSERYSKIDTVLGVRKSGRLSQEVASYFGKIATTYTASVRSKKNFTSRIFHTVSNIFRSTTTKCAIFESRLLVALQSPGLIVLSDFFKSFGLYLPNTLPRHTKLLSYFLKRMVRTIKQSMAHFENLAFLL